MILFGSGIGASITLVVLVGLWEPKQGVVPWPLVAVAILWAVHVVAVIQWNGALSYWETVAYAEAAERDLVRARAVGRTDDILGLTQIVGYLQNRAATIKRRGWPFT